MSTSDVTDKEFLDRVFALAELRLSARQFVEQPSSVRAANDEGLSRSEGAQKRVEQKRSFPSVINMGNEQPIHLHQRVIETIKTPLGTEKIGWTITDLTKAEIEEGGGLPKNGRLVKMKNQPSWDRTKEVPAIELLLQEQYELVTTEHGRPRFAY